MDNGGNSISDDITVDSRAIPEWEKAAQLATALFDLRGLQGVYLCPMVKLRRSRLCGIPWILMIRALQKCCFNPRCS